MALLRLISAVCITPNMRHGRLSKPTSHEFHELIHLIRGRYQASCGAEDFVLAPGELLIIPAGTAHLGTLPLDGSMAYHLVQWTGDCPTRESVKVADGDGRLASACDWLVHRTDHAPPHRRLGRVRRHLLAAMLDEIAISLDGATAPTDPIDRAREFLDRHLHYSSLDLAQAAARAGLSRSRFSALFAERFAITPMRYLRDRRLALARRLLDAGNLTLAQIAKRVGLDDPLYLSRLLSSHGR